MKFTDRFTTKMNQHSSYQRVPFYAIKILQLVSCFLDFVIMSYFVSMLRGSHMHMPWSFIIHIIVFSASTVVLAITIIVYAPAAPPPKISIILNTALFALLGVSFGILAHSLRITLTTSCTVESWNNSTGMMVCRLYKALFSFVVIALATTVLGLILDFHVFFLTRASGTYIRTDNPKPGNLQDVDSEYRGLTQSHISTGSKPVNSDDGRFSYPSTPGFPGSEGELWSNHLDATDIGQGDRELNFLVPSMTYSRANERGYKLPEEQIGLYQS